MGTIATRFGPACGPGWTHSPWRGWISSAIHQPDRHCPRLERSRAIDGDTHIVGLQQVPSDETNLSAGEQGARPRFCPLVSGFQR